MRAACDIYEHPELSTSEVWATKDPQGASAQVRLLSIIGVLSVAATLITVLASHTYGLVDLSALASKGTLLRTLV